MHNHQDIVPSSEQTTGEKRKSLRDLTNLRRPDTGSQMSGHEALNELYKLACRESEAVSRGIGGKEHLDIIFLRALLQKMAIKYVIVPQKLPEDIVTSLFDSETIPYLLMMPNRCAFWSTVQRAAIYQEIIGEPLPIGTRAAYLGYRKFVEDLAISHPNLHAPAAAAEAVINKAN